ncbi:two-component system, OmpR family, response regulator [Candidatus Magnetomorum sp. HK-1]|nr:two-component system, OmpR family, response regulator [Candidatus Magnetomorum sp. HK-1]
MNTVEQKKAKILIIETSMLIDHLVHYFKDKQWEVYKATNDKDINVILQESSVNVVLLNLSDLKKEGLVFISMIKRKFPSVQVITINSGDQIHLSIEGMKLGVFYDFITPLDLDSLINKISEANLAPC